MFAHGIFSPLSKIFKKVVAFVGFDVTQYLKVNNR